MRQAAITSDLRGPLLVLLIALPILAFTGFRVHDAVSKSGDYQRDIRLAQVLRARALRDQLDEETGIRGYVATADPSYLQPYARARAHFFEDFREFHDRLARLDISRVGALAADEAQLNATWVLNVAEPLRADPRQSQPMRDLFARGKTIVDAFRADDSQLQQLLDNAAAAADDETQRAVGNLLFFVIGMLIVIVAGAAAFGFLQARASRRSFETRLLYLNQKRLADSLQTAFLNKMLPAPPNVGLHAMYVPALREAQVGGDWYDAFELPDKRILFSIGDVAGHGLDAAVVMSRARQAIIAAALHENDPAKVLERANDAILLQEARMVTAVCGYIDPATLDVVYATAGHPPPILARAGQPSIFLPHEGMPLGILPDAVYRTFVATASEGAVMVLYTDGVIEHKRDVIRGEERLLEATRLAVLEDDPAAAIHRYVFESSAPADDVAILTFRFKAAPGAMPTVASIGALQHNRWEVPGTSAIDEGPPTVSEPLEAGTFGDDGARLNVPIFSA
jgi:serine phosphatase RsbU (regulator of sigma subunit)